MATLAGILVADKYSNLDSGAAFLLSQKCNVSEVVYINSNEEVEVQEGCPYVVSRIRGASSADDAFNKAYEVAQQGLDMLSITGQADLSIQNASDEYLVWWREQSTQILRVATVTRIPVEIKPATYLLTDKDGNNIPPPSPPQPMYHESFRYLRLSQITDDLFDAFRNAYLALELLLQHITPKQRNEGEGNWLKRSLNSVNNVVPLSSVYSSTSTDVALDIHDNIYKGIRCSIFHAKAQSRLTPQNLRDRKLVSEGLDSLIKIVLLITEHWFYANRPSGFMFHSGFDMWIQPLVLNSNIAVSDNDLPCDNLDTLDQSILQKSVTMPTRFVPELSKAGLNTIVGVIEADQLQKLSKISEFTVINDSGLPISLNLKSFLTYESIDRLEAQIGIQHQNVRQAKQFFKR
jgi:hypothetical protein